MTDKLQKNHKKPPLVKLENITIADFRRLLARLKGAENIKNEENKRSVLAEISQDLAACQARFFARTQHAQNLKIDYPDLPVSARREEILKLISENQVVVIAGETGSGKTTQLPKMCLELGRGVKGLIGHTQPRRIAARSVATRIAEELKSELGETVGYKVRFNDQVSENSLVKLMTDGILLAEIQHDRYLNQYDTLIIDEAHERSLNNDFILGYLKQILHKRPDLKVIITSATIDVERFSKHFNNAPIIEVSGRTFPVEVRYRPIVEDEDQDQLQGILNAVDELQAEGRGDILIFMNGEREIRDTAEALQKQKLRHSEILPLYARLSAAEQQRIFQPSGGLNRIILATNVAETSLTIPNIKYVIDTGTARISRYSYRTKVQRLPIEPISQASANQRKGRCGRTSEGICIRLYSEEDFNSRPQFTDPEILRTNLAAVILQMTSLGLSDIANFPFVDAPDSRQIQDGIRLLEELQAIIPNEKIPSTACGGGLGRGENHSNDGTAPLPTSPRKRGEGFRLTPIGRQLAQLPVDPRLGRMVIEAAKNGSLHEVMMIVSALSIQDPRERPQEKQQSADDKHRRFADKESDFLAFVNLWHFIQTQQKELSKTSFVTSAVRII
ncbi:ATP-dependent RNA helicase [Bibersteinia trehalosi USDA-ARS-USMARC-189]|uniref:ATP-dependent RNA helicase n=1 Tax=Bibersteinia trehalosi USDA-ARS-USMARC-189 TaxID=1263831 RepID=A0ABM5PE46_BIBTR|nr:ATP-dependent RNA helicase [Bibersteinia trehalosi USDA-ARS-USMARC-189]